MTASTLYIYKDIKMYIHIFSSISSLEVLPAHKTHFLRRQWEASHGGADCLRSERETALFALTLIWGFVFFWGRGGKGKAVLWWRHSSLIHFHAVCYLQNGR